MLARERDRRWIQVSLRHGLAVVALLTSQVAVGAANFPVTNTGDSGVGSLRQAILDANANAGLDTISFGIGSGAQTISPTSGLPDITGPVVIDGTTQPGYSGSPIIELSGSNAGANTAGLRIGAGSSTVKGLVINRYSGPTGGGGIYVYGGGGNRVESCYIGTNRAGTAALGNIVGVLVESSNNTIGGVGVGNLISGNGGGVNVYRDTSTGNVIRGNYIGTDASGTAAVPNGFGGVGTTGTNTIIEDNLISGNGSTGVNLVGFATVVRNNRIGTQANGVSPLGNGASGVGGTDLGAVVGPGNIIAFNSGAGVGVVVGSQTTILSNSIFSNTGLGIDVGGDGVTPNDRGDADGGPTGFQNYPVELTASSNGTSISVRAYIRSTPNTTFRIQYFSSPDADPSGFGEGARFIGEVYLTTDANGNSPDLYTITFPVAVPRGHFVSSTATNPYGNTSEFSQAQRVN